VTATFWTNWLYVGTGFSFGMSLMAGIAGFRFAAWTVLASAWFCIWQLIP